MSIWSWLFPRRVPIDAIAGFRCKLDDAIREAVDAGVSDFDIDMIMKQATGIRRWRMADCFREPRDDLSHDDLVMLIRGQNKDM